MKIAVESLNNSLCPQALFLYGTYKENGEPNFGLFCWLSYCWDGELKVMACIGGEKLTKDRITAKGVFSANLVTEDILPIADYLGNTDGREVADKMKKYPLSITRGDALDVPLLDASPRSFELEVERTIQLDDSVVYICKIRKNWFDAKLLEGGEVTSDKMSLVKPVLATGSAVSSYFAVGGKLGNWGDYLQTGF